MVDEKILKQSMELAEEFFGTQNDPAQIPVNLDSYNKLIKLWPESIAYELDDKGQPISWAVTVPTSRELMNKFLKKEITERQLLDDTQPAKIYDCLYLCSVFTLPAHRRQGLALKLLLNLIKTAPLVDNGTLFAWPTTPEGNKLVSKIEQEIGRKILTNSTS